MEKDTPPLFPICPVCREPRGYTHLHACCATAIKNDGIKCPVCQQDLAIASLVIDVVSNPYRLN